MLDQIIEFIKDCDVKGVALKDLITSYTINHHAGKVTVSLNIAISEELFNAIIYRK